MKRILVFAPHPDDEVLGVGGTIKKHVDLGNSVFVCICTRGYKPYFDEELALLKQKHAIKANEILGVENVIFLNFPSTNLENISRVELNNAILNVVLKIKPNIVYIPHFGDMQKDHKIIAEAAMVALRPVYDWKVSEIYSYETLSETEWNTPHIKNTFIPNVFVDIEKQLEFKLKAMKEYITEIKEFPHPRSIEIISALGSIRGSTINSKSAEAFNLIRKVI